MVFAKTHLPTCPQHNYIDAPLQFHVYQFLVGFQVKIDVFKKTRDYLAFVVSLTGVTFKTFEIRKATDELIEIHFTGSIPVIAL